MVKAPALCEGLSAFDQAVLRNRANIIVWVNVLSLKYIAICFGCAEMTQFTLKQIPTPCLSRTVYFFPAIRHCHCDSCTHTHIT